MMYKIIEALEYSMEIEDAGLTPIEINPPETKRIYHFPNREQIVVENICEFLLRKSGDHRLKTTDGIYYVIPNKWDHIELSIEGWNT